MSFLDALRFRPLDLSKMGPGPPVLTHDQKIAYAMTDLSLTREEAETRQAKLDGRR